MKSRHLFLMLCLSAASGNAATLLSLNNVTIGSETTTLVPNGGFESGSGNTTPTGWARTGTMFYEAPTTAALTGFGNLPSTGKVAYYSAPVSGTGVLGLYTRSITGLTANTKYVLSSYVWNKATAANTGTGDRNLVIDMNDVSGEAQIVLSPTQPDATDGYFAYQTFDTTDTGTSFTLRIFTNPGTYGTAGKYHVWDNVAITKESDFVAPTTIPEPSSAILGSIGFICLAAYRRRG